MGSELSAKAYRVVGNCRTLEQATVAWQWLLLACRADARMIPYLDYYAHHLNQAFRPSRPFHRAEFSRLIRQHAKKGP